MAAASCSHIPWGGSVRWSGCCCHRSAGSWTTEICCPAGKQGASVVGRSPTGPASLSAVMNDHLSAAASRWPRVSAALAAGLCVASCSPGQVQRMEEATPPRPPATAPGQVAAAARKLDAAAATVAESKKAAAYCAWEHHKELESWKAEPSGPVPVSDCLRQELKAASAMTSLIDLHSSLLKSGETTAPIAKYLMATEDPMDPVRAWHEKH